MSGDFFGNKRKAMPVQQNALMTITSRNRKRKWKSMRIGL